MLMSMNAGGHKTTRKRASTGFTLIELMIVVVIIGILAAIGYPSYLNYANRAKRSDGKNALLELASRQERHYFDNSTYTNDPTELGYNSDPAISTEGYYNISISDAPTNNIATGYTLTATPINPFNDPECGNLSLNSRGVKARTGSAPMDKCW